MFSYSAKAKGERQLIRLGNNSLIYVQDSVKDLCSCNNGFEFLFLRKIKFPISFEIRY